MHLVGNDIVCLEEALSIAKHKNIRWINKNFNPEEIKCINEATDPGILMWRLWSCKESAYKVIVKKDSVRFLNAKKIRVVLDDKGEYSSAYYRDYELCVKNVTNEKYTHSICAFSRREVKESRSNVISINNESNIEVSSFIRNSLRNELKALFGEKELIFTKDKLGVPKVNTKHSLARYDVSFSHDGKYSSYSFITDRL